MTTTTTNATSPAVKWIPPWGSALPPPVRASTPLQNKAHCPACLEENQMTFSICSCQQEVCHACHTAWFYKKPNAPCCPVYTKSVDREELLQVLGIEGPLIIKSATTSSEPPEDDGTTDSLTHDWLMMQDNAQRCPECNIWIIKYGGCEHVTCSWCDFEFCWYCLVQINDCKEEHDEEDNYDEDGGENF